jgi:hypothetical protein
VDQSRAKNANSTLANRETHRIEIVGWQHKHIGTHWMPKSDRLGLLNNYGLRCDRASLIVQTC